MYDDNHHWKGKPAKMMSATKTLFITVSRKSTDTPWGFTLVEGDHPRLDRPLVVQNVSHVLKKTQFLLQTALCHSKESIVSVCFVRLE